MPHPHYVAQTFLRHSTDAAGKLHAYSIRAIARGKPSEALVFLSPGDHGIEKLVRKYGKYRIESEPQEWRTPDGGDIHGSLIRVRPRTD